MIRYGMVIDLKKCVGCDACSLVCKAENATPRGVLWNRILKYETGKYPNSRLDFLPVICMHCEEPECEKVCPSGATKKRKDGIVTVDNNKCIGCRYCMIACPYGVRHFLNDMRTYYPNHMTPFEQIGYKNHVIGTVEKCDFCVKRVEQGLKPACVLACPADARYFGDLNDSDSEVSRLIKEKGGFVLNPELETKPSVYYLPNVRGESVR